MVVTLNVESTGTFYQERWCATYDPCDGGEEFGIVDYGPRGTPEVYLVQAYATGAWNSAHYESQQFSDVVVAYQEAVDLSGRKQAISEAQAIANEDVPYVIPYFAHSLIAYSDTVTGIVATGLGHLHLGSAGFRVTG